jgi:hypothetical protein
MPAKRIICILSTVLTLCSPLPSSAEMTMTVTTPGDGVFYLVGANVDDVEAVDLTVDYDTTFLANPQVGLQGGTFTGISADTPGKLSVSVFREYPEAVFELDLNFERRGDFPGVINYVTATMKDTEGRHYPVHVTIISPPPPPVKHPEYEAGANGAVKAPSPAGAVSETRRDSGLPRGISGETPDSSTDTASAARQPAAKPEQAATTDQTPSEGAYSPWTVEKSVLQRFREFRGEKRHKEFVALFHGGDGKRIVQEPAIALSDGKSPVRIRLRLEHEWNYAPNFALSDAKFVSLKKDGEKSWVMTVVPSEGAWKVSLILKMGREMFEFPLVVAPPVKILSEINEKSFHLALTRYISAQAAESDGESGPFRQYLHEYIFTANYLAKQAINPAKQASR